MKRKTLLPVLAVMMVLVLGLTALSACEVSTSSSHQFSADWTTDATSHWHACETHTDDENDVSDKAEHTFDSGVITKEATETEEGVITYTCTVCGYEKTESIAKLEHTHTFEEGWTADALNHWHKATCSHTSERSDLAPHTFDEGVITKEPTCTAEGIKTFTCTVCGKTKTEAVEALGHTWDEGVVTTEPTCLAEGTKTFTCSVCGETRTESIPKIDHADEDGDGRCDSCHTGMINYTFTFSFDTAFPYSDDASLVTVTLNDEAVTLEGGKYTAGSGDVFVFSHPNYMPVSVTTGTDADVTVSFVRAKAATGNATYDEANKTLTVGGWQLAQILSPAGADFAVQLEIDPQNIQAWSTYGIGIHAGSEYFSYGFSRRSNDYASGMHLWGFVSPSKGDWYAGLFSLCPNKANLTGMDEQLAAKSLEHVTLTLIYHNDTKVLDAYFNGILVINYATGLTGDATAVSILSTDVATTYRDWNYGLAGSGAYNGILESVGVHQWDNGVVTTEPTCSAEGTLTYTCTVCGETRTESIPKIAHTDEDANGVCDVCGEGVVPYNFAFSFDTAFTYSTDTSLVTVTRNGIAVTLTDGKYTAAPGDTFVFSHPNYMPVTVTTGTDEAVTVSFVRAKAATGNATYDEANKTLTLNGSWKQAQILSPAGADFAVQLEIDPQNIASWLTYGIGIQADNYFNYGFSRRNNDYVTGKYAWGFVSPSKSDWTGPGLFNLSAYTDNLTALAEQLGAKTLEHVTLTFVYHNDTKVLDAYVNGILVVNYATGITGNATSVVLISTDTSTTYLDWNYGLAGSGAYNGILESVGVHQWDNGVVTTEPTCTAEGTKTYTCTVCGETKTETVAALGHTWDEGTVTVEPTCTTEGTKTFTCSVCGETKTETIAALGHTWDEGTVTTEPTCTTEGTKTFTCSVCGETKTETIAALGHTWDEGTVTVAPTCTTEGTKTYTCTVCGETKTETIAALGHTWDEGTDGVCDVCGETIV